MEKKSEEQEEISKIYFKTNLRPLALGSFWRDIQNVLFLVVPVCTVCTIVFLSFR